MKIPQLRGCVTPQAVKGVIITLKGGAEDCVDAKGKPYDFISRYFAPWVGIPEDPVTGTETNSKLFRDISMICVSCAYIFNEQH